MPETSFDCIVIGAGPGGYVAAIRASQLGLKTAVVEKEAPGGVCLNWGCIPTKALLKSAEVLELMRHASNYGLRADGISFDFAAVMKRSRSVVDRMTKGVQFLFRKNNITYIQGHGRLSPGNNVVVSGENGSETVLNAKNIILATGARARTLPSLPIDGERVITARHALEVKECPKKLLVVGAGAIGIEFAYFFRAFGAEVTVVEVLDHILPIEDDEIAKALEKSLFRLGIQFRTKTKVESLSRDGASVNAVLQSPEGTEQWSGDSCIVAIGVQGNIENLGLDLVGVQTEKSYIKVDQFCQTSVPGISAIGDVIGPPWLAHVASHEGIVAAEHIAGQPTHPVDYSNVPGCTYCQPQVASIGLTEKKATDAGYKVRIGRFPFTANGMAVATGETDGFVKVVIDSETEEVLGVHIIHPEAATLIGEASIIRSHEGVASSVVNTIHAHPTLTEALMEAMGDAIGRPIHI